MFEELETRAERVESGTPEDPVGRLREDLLSAQFDLVTSKQIAVLILVSGLEGSGRGDMVNALSHWMDSRHFHIHALGEPTSEEAERPAMWAVWRRMPPKGEIAVFFRAWGSRELFENPTMTEAARLARIDEIARFERMLAAEGVLVLNFYIHLSKKQQRRRLEKLALDPRTAWRVTKSQWKLLETSDESVERRARVLKLLSTPETPWIALEGSSPKKCAEAAGRTLLEALRRRLAAPASAPAVPLSESATAGKGPSPRAVAALDYSLALSPEDYAKRLAAAQERFAALVLKKRFRKERSLVVVFEGVDAAGKGGAIRRLTGPLDARQYTTIPIAAPTEEERARPYLWRFWRHVPGHGQVAIFDRSWYGRILVERVEGFCQPGDWARAYGEVNDFEADLDRAGAILIKFWLQITKDEQLARFKARENTGFKRYKITDEDWRNRDKWDAYETAVDDMVARTSTETAPWVLVPANDKLFARVRVVEAVCERLEQKL
ncbi:MAG TPA: polyphosphate:AMP phosphotransferase [Planctomycetota bacterium]|nr:polyphosphate:AMP phosphotransferase [Planctomycetota bacterium]